jgi:hypothetical protein
MLKKFNLRVASFISLTVFRFGIINSEEHLMTQEKTLNVMEF